MKKILSTLLVIILILSLNACGDEPDVTKISSQMINDKTVVATFENQGNSTVTYVKGRLNLFTGSSTSQIEDATATFEWNGSCEKGDTFEITAEVINSSAGLANRVNRIGYFIYDVK